MKRILQTSALVAAAMTIPAVANAQSYNSGYSAHQACKKSEDNKQIIGGLLGAVAGGVIGSQVAGDGARTEGSAIGVLVGGLAGAGIADKTVDCDPAYPVASSQGYYGESSPVVYGSGQNHYEDRVTVSNHPVYSDPTYGANYGYSSGAVSQGTTYSTGTTTYPPYSGNSGYVVSQPQTTYGSTYSQPTYSQPRYVQTTYSQPTYARTTYSQPTYRQSYHSGHGTSYRHKPISHGRRHFHGKYECNSFH